MNLIIPNWRRAWRMASMQIAGIAVVFGTLPQDAQAADNLALTTAAALAASLRSNQQDIIVAQFIDLMFPDTRGGVQALEAYGLIGAGRAAEIIDTPPTGSEVFDG